MSAHEKPILLNISLCDLVIRDQHTHKVSLINLFNELRAPAFPCTHPRLYVYACLTNGRGSYDCALVLSDPEMPVPMANLPSRLTFQSPLQVVEMSFELNALVLPHEGTYRFELLCDGEVLGARSFDAAALPKGPASKPQ